MKIKAIKYPRPAQLGSFAVDIFRAGPDLKIERVGEDVEITEGRETISLPWSGRTFALIEKEPVNAPEPQRSGIAPQAAKSSQRPR